MDLKKIMTGANPQSIMLEQTRGLKAKWEKTGLLEGAGSETSKHGICAVFWKCIAVDAALSCVGARGGVEARRRHGGRSHARRNAA